MTNAKKKDKNPSPDCNGNPFLQKKDCNVKREIAPKKLFYNEAYHNKKTAD